MRRAALSGLITVGSQLGMGEEEAQTIAGVLGDEPWLIPRDRRRRTRRGVMLGAAGALAAGALVTVGAVVTFSSSGPVSRTTRHPSTVSSPAPGVQGDQGRLVTPPSMEGSPSRQPPRPRSGDAKRGGGPGRIQSTPSEPAPAPTRTRRHPRGGKKQGHRAPEHSRPETGAPRRPQRPPGWVRAECRRRFPHDATRQAACVAAVRGYLW